MGNIIDKLTGKEALRRQLAESEQLRRRQLAESEQLRRIQFQLRTGEYYTTAAIVWESSEMEFSEASLDAVRRTEPHPFYQKTIDAAKSDEPRPAYESSRSAYDPASSLEENAGDSKTELSRKRRLGDIAIDGEARDVAEVAHLIPYSQNCATFYGPLVEAATGWDLSRDHSVQPPMKKLKQMVLVHGQFEKSQDTKPRRVLDTGLKHCRTNMARIVAQKRYLDFDPSQLFIPILTIDETLRYSKGKYQVLVACSSPKVYCESLFQERYALCTEEDVRVATETLASFVKATAYTLSVADEGELEMRLERNPQKKRILGTKRTLGNMVKVPAIRHWSNNIKLAKVSLDMSDSSCHQECDPFLLFVRAAVVWSSMEGQLLLPGCPTTHDCEECLENGLFECECEAYDPDMPIPQAITVPYSKS